eukprot:TRINITY_DN2299_c0_g1_i2.p1 TRINITY_DN2299_c0_g1~~TRINITY_DN2299_c0_g1_i2.p1  ORF type:complete len:502 (+),score=44.59 TRINITY_DN2299_c0_g1_i2:62-1567(+)
MKKSSPAKKGVYEVFETSANYHQTQSSFTQSECIVPNYMSTSIETSVVTDKKAKSKMNAFKSLSLNRKKQQHKEFRDNTGYFPAEDYRYSMGQGSENRSLPTPSSPIGNVPFVDGCKRSYEIDEYDSQPNYEEIDGPNAERIPWYNTVGQLFTSAKDPILKLDSMEPQDEYMDMEPTYNEATQFMELSESNNDRGNTYNEPSPLMKLSESRNDRRKTCNEPSPFMQHTGPRDDRRKTYNEPSPFMQHTELRNDRKVNTKPIKPDIIPPMRKTISHNTVHSYKCSIVAPAYQDMVPEPPKRAISLGNRVEKKPTSPSIKVRGKWTSGYDLVPNFRKEISNKNSSFEKIVNEEIPTKIEPHNQENNRDDVIPSFPTKQKSQTLKPAPKPNTKLRRSDSSPKNQAPTRYEKNLSERTDSTKSPPAPAVKPRRPKENVTEAPKELNEQKKTVGERNDRVMKDLGNHLKQLSVVDSIHCNSQFKQLNLYQESPSKGVGLKKNSFEE